MTAVYVVAAVAAALLAELRPGGVALLFKLVPVSLLLVQAGRPLLAGDRGRFRRFLVMGLAFSVVGDLVIAFAFVGGIAAFLVAHGCYLAAMGWSGTRKPAQLLALLPALALWGAMVAVVVPRAPHELRAPVVVYATVISAMLGRATGRALVTDPSREATVMCVGAWVFALSDSLIAISKWVAPVPHAELAILGTYYAAQALISRGLPAGPSPAAAG